MNFERTCAGRRQFRSGDEHCGCCEDLTETVWRWLETCPCGRRTIGNRPRRRADKSDYGERQTASPAW